MLFQVGLAPSMDRVGVMNYDNASWQVWKDRHFGVEAQVKKTTAIAKSEGARFGTQWTVLEELGNQQHNYMISELQQRKVCGKVMIIGMTTEDIENMTGTCTDMMTAYNKGFKSRFLEANAQEFDSDFDEFNRIKN
jgi:hypothetical protein